MKIPNYDKNEDEEGTEKKKPQKSVAIHLV